MEGLLARQGRRRAHGRKLGVRREGRDLWKLRDGAKRGGHCEVSESDKECGKVRLSGHRNTLSMTRMGQRLFSNGVTR